jgi:L-alanine-DL-glutamate epimerase-like enolase superfamily enzyme
MPNFLITEYFVNFETRAAEIARMSFIVENSYLALPAAPGLGIDLDETALAKYPYREFPLRHLRNPADEEI